MADFCVDDFLINPTIHTLDRQSRRHSIMSKAHHLRPLPISSHSDLIYGKASSSKVNDPMADLINRPTFWPAYTSDEELVSPIEDDGNSLRSFSSGFSLHEDYDETSVQVEQQCSHAQIVRIQPAGRATMIEMPKLVDIEAKRQSIRSMSRASMQDLPAQRGHFRSMSRASMQSLTFPIPPRQSSYDFSRKTRTSQDSRSSYSGSSRHNSVSSVSPQSPASTAPSSTSSISEPRERPYVAHKKSSSYSRHVPLMEAARAVPSFTPIISTIPGPTPTIERSDSVTSSSYGARATIRRTKKFSVNLGLSKLGKTLTRRDTLEESREEEYYDNVKETEPVMMMVAPEVPRTRTSMHRHKMVARPANSRTAPITLPPCPYSQQESINYDDAHWPL